MSLIFDVESAKIAFIKAFTSEPIIETLPFLFSLAYRGIPVVDAEDILIPDIMASEQVESSSLPSATAPNIHNSSSTEQDTSPRGTPSLLSTSGISSWARSLKIPKASAQEDPQPGNTGKSPFARLASGFRLSPKSPQDESAEGTSTPTEPGVFGSLTKGLMDSSRSAVKAVQVKARHMVSQNKRRYQVVLASMNRYPIFSVLCFYFPVCNL